MGNGSAERNRAVLDAVFKWLVDRLSMKGEKDRGVIVLRWLFFGGMILAAVALAIALLSGGGVF